jgi:hypothetical protein
MFKGARLVTGAIKVDRRLSVGDFAGSRENGLGSASMQSRFLDWPR